jgi:hypothetical protein
MPFEINYTPTPDRVIRMGQADEVLAPKVKVIKQGRKAMPDKSDKEKLEEAGAETIRKDRADKQGPIGSDSPPRQPEAGEDVRIGNKEGDKNA